MPDRDNEPSRALTAPGRGIRRVVRVAGIAVAITGCVVLAGWWLNLQRITTVLEGSSPMKPNAAVGLALAGLGVALSTREHQSPPTRRAVMGTGSVLIVLGGLTLMQVLASVDLKLDRVLLPPGGDAASAHPGRMATMAAVSLIATGGGLILQLRSRATGTHVLAFAGLSIGYVGLLGYLYGVSSLYHFDGSSGMAVHMAGAACILGLAVELCVPDRGLARLLRESGSAGRITRTLVPTVAVVVPLIGWVLLRGEVFGWYQPPFTTAVTVVAVGILGSALTLWAAIIALRGDERRDRTVESMRALTASLAQSEQRWRRTIEHSPIGIALSQLDGHWLRANPAFCRVLGYTEQELLASTPHTHPDDVEAEGALHAQLLSGEIEHFTLEQRYRHARGRWVWVRRWVSVVRDENEKPLHFISQIEDISERRARTERLAALALQDPLTGLSNRTAFLERLDAAAANCDGKGPRFGVIYIDLDNFKQINDTLGHGAGDQMLAACARRLTSGVRPGDTMARLGGDEFALLVCPLAGRREAVDIARRMLDDLTVPYHVADTTVRATVSIGVALHADDQNGEQTLAAADEAMYRAKRAGKGRYVVLP